MRFCFFVVKVPKYFHLPKKEELDELQEEKRRFTYYKLEQKLQNVLSEFFRNVGSFH